ncbi:MAG TPA: glycosyltransferase family 4 protein [Thermoanaerobaculia bacterium]|nr:glycosyltransferase family 4 protein [Thermoanaerobaculia bacterium]
MLQLLAPEHRVTLLTPAPRAGRPQLPPLPAGTVVATYRAAGRGGERTSAGERLGAASDLSGSAGERLGAAGERLGAASDLLGAAGDLLGAAGGLARAAVHGLPLQSGLFFSADLRRQLRRLAPRADLVVLQLVRLAAHRADLGRTPVLIDLIDDLALNFSRRAAIDRWWLRPALALEARLLARAQCRLARSAAGVLLVCDRDRRELTAHLAAALAGRVWTAGLAVETSGGPPSPSPAAGSAASASGLAPGTAFASPLAPGAAFAGPPLPGAAAFAGPPRLVFTGNLGYFVNADAISWWLREVWPALAARRPDLEVVVAGDRPRPGLRRALAAAGSVTVVESPPDLPELLAGAAAALAPMRCGSGLPIKILEAWSRGVPVVASPWAAAGTTGVSGEDLLVAGSPRQWLEAMDRLLDDPAEGRRLAANGRRRLQADYSRRQVKQQLLAAVEAAVSGR